MQEEVKNFRGKGFYYCIPSLYVYISVVLLFYSHKMKRTFFTSAIAVAMLWITVSFAQSPLAEQFTTLSEQIIEQSARPFDKLEELKALFTSCAEKHSSPEVKAACAEWLARSYQKMKEATPQQIYVELGSGDVEVKKIGEITLPVKAMVVGEQQQTFMQYEVNIPKYHFTYQFMLDLGAEEVLKSWRRSQSGSIAIPDSWSKKLYPKTMFRLYSTSSLNSKSSLEEVWKLYKQVFKHVYALKNPKAMYNELFEKWNKDELATQEYLFFLKDNQPLPPLITTLPEWTAFSGAIENLYGFMKWPSYFCMVANLMRVGKEFVWPCDEKEKTTNPYWWGFWADEGGLFWNRNTPQYVWSYGNVWLETLPNLWRWSLIIK